MSEEMNDLLLTEEAIQAAFNGDFGEVSFDHKPTPDDILLIKLKLVAQAQLAKVLKHRSRPQICKDCPTFEQGCEGSNREDCERRSRPELREALAELEHKQWQAWASGLLPELDRLVAKHKPFCDCETCIRTQRWRVLLGGSYAELMEEAKDQDRVWADKVLLLYPDEEEIKQLKAEIEVLKKESAARLELIGLLTDRCEELKKGE